MSAWTKAISLEDLGTRDRAVVKLAGKQILILRRGETFYAANNRCPHEGYPLSEGSLAHEGCVLTCNWHNWKFDLVSGETLMGGDTLRRYPIRREGDDLLIDLTDPPAAERRAKALRGLDGALAEHDYDRMARELCRFTAAEGTAEAAVAHAIVWASERLEFGTTHAIAGAPDWLALASGLGAEQEADRLVPYLEIIGHLSWDCLQRPGRFPYLPGPANGYDAERLEAAIEEEDEKAALAQVEAGLAEGGPQILRPALERAALAHYQDFGHSAIYLVKTYELLERLGPAADAACQRALLFCLTRSYVAATREDLIPEFRAYGKTLAAWDPASANLPSAEDFRGAGVGQALAKVAGAAAEVDRLYEVLMTAAADSMLHYDANYRVTVDRPVQDNVDWLDFTHALTFLNASRQICGNQPALWPAALLQAACFLGRNARYCNWDQDTSGYQVGDAETFFATRLEALLDHGEPIYIFPVHALKLTTALAEERTLTPKAEWIDPALAALKRFSEEPVKRKHQRRSLRQAERFVALEV